jgi:hypothetical protein
MAAKKESRFFDAKENMALSKRQAYYNQSLAKMVRVGYQKSPTVKKIFGSVLGLQVGYFLRVTHHSITPLFHYSKIT